MASLTRMPEGLGASPELQVFGAVVVANTVDVVDGLPFHQVQAKLLLGHQDVFQHVTEAGAGMIGHPHHEVASLVPRAASPPVAIGLPGHGAARRTRCRLDLLGVATRAQILGSTSRATPMAARRLEHSSTLAALPVRHVS